MTTLNRILGRAARWAVVAAASALTTLAIGLPIAMTGAHGGDPGTLPVPRNLLGYLALIVLGPILGSSVASVFMAARLRLLDSERSLPILTIIQVVVLLPILCWLVQLADFLPS